MVKVSIIIPIYNVERFLKRCLNSVINQSLEDIEIICINDGSTDNSLSIIKEFSENDSRIKTYNRTNHGLGASRNFGIRKALGEYILFVDSDDWIELDTCEKLFSVAKKNNLDILQGKFNKVDDDGHKNSYHFFNSYPKNNVMTGLDFFNKAQPILSYNWDKLWKRDFFLNNNLYNIENIFYEDLVTTYKAYILAEKVMYIDFPFYNYYINSNSITNVSLNKKHIKGRVYQFSSLFDLIESNNLFNHKGIAYSFLHHLDVIVKIYINSSNNKERLKLKHFIYRQKRKFKNKYSISIIFSTKLYYGILIYSPFIVTLIANYILLLVTKLSPVFIRVLYRKILKR